MTEETSLNGASASSGKGSQAWEQRAVSDFVLSQVRCQSAPCVFIGVFSVKHSLRLLNRKIPNLKFFAHGHDGKWENLQLTSC